MNILIFLVTVIISFIIVRIGAIAFQLTGLDWSLAKFQALSCFSGTGFTTKEAELITTHAQRRKIASILMILGNAGLVTLIATLANSLNPNVILPEINIPFLNLVLPVRFVPIANFLIIIFLIFIGYKFFSNTKISNKLTGFLRKRLIKTSAIKPVTFAELVSTTGGYDVSSIDVEQNNLLVGKNLKESNFKANKINVLVIERDSESIVNPPDETKIKLGDKIIFFGRRENIREVLKKMCPDMYSEFKEN